MATRMFLLILITLGFILPAVAAEPRAEKVVAAPVTSTVSVDKRQTKAQVDKRQIKAQLAFDPAMVPEGKTYYLMKNGKVDKKFKSGSSTPMVADCAQIKCPKTFDKDIVCWKCIER